MIKFFFRLAIVIFITLTSYTLKIFPNDLVISTLYTVASIFLSIGLSLIMTFDFTNIRDESFYKTIKDNVHMVRKTFLIYFGMMSFAYLGATHFIKSTSTWANTETNLFFNIMITPSLLIISIAFSILLLGLLCFIFNFIFLQKLKNDIDERVRESRKSS